MQGYDVRTIDGDYLVVEHGLLKTKHALPTVFAEVDADEQVVRTTLSKDPQSPRDRSRRSLSASGGPAVAANEGPSGVVLGGSDDPRPSDYDGD
jgi:hypothetical protein